MCTKPQRLKASKYSVFLSVFLLLLIGNELYLNNKQLDSCLTTSTEHENNSHCRPAYLANKNWLAWFSGGSQSAHFHFLDLIELLYQLK